MSLRTQLALFSAVAVAIAVVVVSVVAYFATENRLRSQVDDSLRGRSLTVADAQALHGRGGPREGEPRGEPHDPYAETDTFFQIIDKSGNVVGAPDNQQLRIPVGGDDVAVASGAQRSVMHDATDDGVHLRVLTNPGAPGEAVQVARSLAEVDGSLSSLRNVLFGVSGAGIALAAVLGLAIAHRALRPVARLTSAAEHVAATQDLDASIEVRRNDEIGRLARSFNAMLQALRESRVQQRQLVSDASHELRTPLTSLRTNIEVLARDHGLPESERRQLLHDATFELEELTKLVGELVELAAEARTEAQGFEDVRLDELAAAVVRRSQRRTGMRIALDAQPSLVVGSYNLLERAAGNLVDNAAKWSPSGGTIEVTVRDGRFEVRDHGPGIPEADRPHVFDRFYRADTARSKPGSGLGLAIVKQIIEAHGGTVSVEPAAGGGTRAWFALAAVPIDVEPSVVPAFVGSTQTAAAGE